MPTISRRCACSSWAVLLFQFFEDFICGHAAGQQLFQHFFSLDFFCFFDNLCISDRLSLFQGSQFFLCRLKSNLLLFQVIFQSINVCGDGCDFRCERFLCGLLFCNLSCEISNYCFRLILATFCSGHKKNQKNLVVLV